MTKLEDDIVLLEKVSYQYFGVNPDQARRKAALNTLPVPAFRLSGTRHGPLYVRKSDIEKHLEEVYARAAEGNSKMRSVTMGR